MLHEGFGVARCTVERLMAHLGFHCAIRGKPIRTEVQDKAAPCPRNRVTRVFHALAPKMLWLSDFTHVSSWSAFVYMAFVIDAYSHSVVGLKGAGRRMRALFSMFSSGLCTNGRPFIAVAWCAILTGGSQYVIIRYTGRLAEPTLNHPSAASEPSTTTPWPR